MLLMNLVTEFLWDINDLQWREEIKAKLNPLCGQKVSRLAINTVDVSLGNDQN